MNERAMKVMILLDSPMPDVVRCDVRRCFGARGSWSLFCYCSQAASASCHEDEVSLLSKSRRSKKKRKGELTLVSRPVASLPSHGQVTMVTVECPAGL